MEPSSYNRPDLEEVEVTRNYSELFRRESTRLIQETDKACQRIQDASSKRLEQWSKDVQFLRTELERKFEENNAETDALQVLQGRVTKALEACKEPLRVSTLCLEERMKRPPSEKPGDQVDRELLKEKEGIEGVSALLQRVAQQITQQIRVNRSAKYHLERDLMEKHEAQCIDNTCALMTAHSIRNWPRPKDPSSVLVRMPVTPVQWENFSETNLAKAEEQNNNSQSLRALVESLLEQTAADMRKQFQATERAFQLNVKEVKSAKSQLESQLSRILSEISSQEKNRQSLVEAVTEQEAALSLAQAQVEVRRQRPLKERCDDMAHRELIAKVLRLTHNISRLREAVNQSEVKLRELVRCKVELQENIQMKSTALYIDEVTCAQLRGPVVIHNF